MERQAVYERILPVFRKIFEQGDLQISDNTVAADVENWDSLTNVLMVDAVEKEFGIKFKLREILNMKNVGDLVSCIVQGSNSRNNL